MPHVLSHGTEDGQMRRSNRADHKLRLVAVSERPTDDLLERWGDLLREARGKLADGELEAAENLWTDGMCAAVVLMTHPHFFDDALHGARLETLSEESRVVSQDLRASGADPNRIRALMRRERRPKLVK